MCFPDDVDTVSVPVIFRQPDFCKRFALTETNTSCRLFFALRPDAAQRAVLADWSAQLPPCHGRRVPADNIHLTLAFLGETEAERQDCLERAAGGVRSPPFELVVDRVGYFARARVLWVGPTQPPPALPQLVEQLNRALSPCGYVPEPRPFHPHVTLARKARPPRVELAPPHCVWHVDRFCLMVSESAAGGARYRVIREYPLNG
jgi:RNA 2',3'-cyclic 3'-phosphodiesterase